MSSYPHVPLGEVLTRADNDVIVESDQEYVLAGLYSFGRGLFARSTISGSETRYKSLYRLHQGQLVYARLNAWEGAVAVVTPDHQGLYVSQEFPVFNVDLDRALPSYLGWISRWKRFWDALMGVARGIGSQTGARRLRVHPDRFLSARIPLPGIPEQARIAEWLDSIESLRSGVANNVQHIESRLEAVLPALVSEVLNRYPGIEARLGDFVDPVSDVYKPGDDPASATEFVGMEHIESHTGRRLGSGPVGDERGSKKRFAPNDIVYGKLRPYLNKVWVADRHGLCSVDQVVFRPKEDSPGELIAISMLSQRFLNGVIDLTHEAQLPRIRLKQLLDQEIRIPNLEHRTQVTSELKQLRDRVQQLLTLHSARAEEVDAIIPSAINSVLNST